MLGFRLSSSAKLDKLEVSLRALGIAKRVKPQKKQPLIFLCVAQCSQLKRISQKWKQEIA